MKLVATNQIRFLYLISSILVFFLFPTDLRAITLSPTKQTIVISPGKSELIKIEVHNDSEVTKIITPELDGFTIDDRTGRPIFGSRDEATNWITPLRNEIILKPGRKSIITFTVRVPKDASTSGHYIGLFAKEKNSDGQIGLSSRVGSLLFLYTEGKINENLYLVSFNTEKKPSEKNTVKLFLNLKNNGNIHLVPDGEIVIRNWSKKIVARININELNRKVLPGGFWLGEYSIPLPATISNIGILTAEADITYGLTKQKMGSMVSLWYLPISIMIYLFEFSLLIILVILIAKKYLKK